MASGRITPKQQEILDFLKKEILTKGYPPAVREICEAVHLKSTSSVHSHLETLEKNGYIRRDPTKPRAIEIMDDSFNYLRTETEITSIPIIGTVAAGQPLLAVENITDYFPFPAQLLPNEETFILRVKGESMVNMGIYDGDYLIVEKTGTARLWLHLWMTPLPLRDSMLRTDIIVYSRRMITWILLLLTMLRFSVRQSALSDRILYN